MLNAVLDGAPDAPINVLARLKLTSELTALLKEQAVIQPGAPMAALKSAKVASQIIVVLGKLGVDLAAGRRSASAFQLEGGPEPVAQPRVSTAHFFDYDPNRKSSQRRKDNADAIALLRRIDAGEIQADSLTEEQKQTLAKYSGTGGNLIGADGLKGSAYEYYTPKPIASGMWSLLAEMGFAGGKVSDPASGTGVFGATAPVNAVIEAVELSEVSGRINQLVNGGPGYSAVVSPFEAVASRTADEQYDAVITNVPFGGVHDRGANRKLDDRYQDDTLETYFILRSLEKLKPGGLAAFIVPPRIVSGKGGREEKLRIAMSYKAEFMGAYRLPNSVFGTADADTITDVIVLRKFGRDAAEKIAEIKEQSPEVLTKAKVQWVEFISGNYFAGEGHRYVLGEFQAKDPNKFRDVDRVISNASPVEIAKLLRKFPGSRIDWALLEATETAPIFYSEGDTMVSAGQTLEMRDGAWVALPKAQDDTAFDAVGQSLGSATRAARDQVTWAQAGQYVKHLQNTGKELDIPDWLRAAHSDVGKVDRTQQDGYWGALVAGMAVVEVSRAHGAEVGFNYDDEYPFLSKAMRENAATAKKGFAKFSANSKASLVKIGVMFDRRKGFSPVWTGDVASDVMEGVTLDADAKVDAFKYRAQTTRIPLDELKGIYGADFDALADDGWCVVEGGQAAMRADDYYVGNLGDLLARLDDEIGKASGAVRDKLLRQKALASDRVDVIDPESLRYNLFSPFVTLEEKAEFLRRFMHPTFVVGVDDDGDKVIICDIKSPANERERQLKRFAEYLKRGTLSTRTSRDDALSNPRLEDMRRKMLRDMAASASAQFDQWVKSNPMIMERLHQTVNDPARLYFNEVDDESPLQIPGLHPDFNTHGYQAAYARKQGRQFGGVNGFGVGLGKTATAAASVLYVQSIGVKKKTIFVVPNSVLSKWRVELVTGKGSKGNPGYKPPVFASGDTCLWVGMDVLDDGSVKVDSGNYTRDFTRILENRHRMIFCTMEAFKAIPLKDETIEAYEAYMRRVDPAYTGSDKKAETERAESKLAEVTSGTGQKSSAIPFFEDMGIDSIVIDEGHAYKNSKETVDFSGAKFLSVSESSQRGKDAQIKAWFLREGDGGDPPLVLTATPITNSPLEIYSMMCLAAGEDKVHALTMGARGADAFMEVMCDIEEDEEPGIDGVKRPMRVFRGLQNMNLLRGLLHTVATVKTAKDVGGTIHVPEAPENQVRVQLTPHSKTILEQYRLAYQGARESMKTSGTPTDEQIAAMQIVAAKFGEPISLIAHPFNLINKMTMVIADPELDDRATYYLISAADRDKAEKVCEQFNKKNRTEWRRAPGPLTRPEAVGKPKITRNGEAEAAMYPCRIEASVQGGRIAVDTMDTEVQSEFEAMADKAGLDLDCTVPPKLAALLENVRTEEGNPRSGTGRVKQLVFCDILPMHNKIKRVLSKRAGIPMNQIAVISGKTIKSADQIQDIQDGFNAEGEGAKFRTVIANEKAEVGIDLQIGTQAIHHFTIGWTPDSITQRNGRGARQGNRVERVNVYFYDADGTFDQYKRTLTGKKAEWIDDVMSPDGGNDVQVSGGLTNEQYDELIQSMGDEKAIAAIQERAELRERQARAETARARQVINLRTAAAQADFVKAFKKPEDWAKSKIMALYDLRLNLNAMKSRAAGGKLKADGLVKLQARIAEVETRVAGMAREIDASVRVKSRGYGGWKAGDSILKMLDEKSHYSIASKVREDIESRITAYTELTDGSDLDMEWQQEIASAEKMQEEALNDFARLASQDGTLPAQLIEAQRAGQVAVYSGQVLARGMFVRLKDTRLCVMDAPDRIVRFPKGLVITPADAITAGAAFIMFGTPEYEAALKEAAEFDDAADGVQPSNVGYLFGSIMPEVAQRRAKPVQVECDRASVVLGAGPYRYPIDTSADGISPALRALAARQPGVLGWAGGRVLMDASASYRIDHPGYSGSETENSRLSELVDVAKAEGTPFTLVDYVVASRGASAAKDKFWAVNLGHKLIENGAWPDVPWGQNHFASAETKDAVNAMVDQMTRDAFKDFFVFPEGRDIMEMANYKVRDDYNRRLSQIEKAEELKQMEAEMAASLAQAKARGDADPDQQEEVTPPAAEEVVPAPNPEPTPVSAVSELAVQASPLKLAPWTSKTGEARIYFNGIPGAGRRETPYGKADKDGFVTIVMPDGLLPVRETQFTQFIEENLAKMNGGEEVDTFALLQKLAGVVSVPDGEVSQDASGFVGIAGETKPNMGIIKAAAAMAGGRAIWMGKSGKLQWNVPAAAWDLIVQKHPDAAKALYKVPA